MIYGGCSPQELASLLHDSCSCSAFAASRTLVDPAMAGTMARIAHDLALPLWYQPASALSYRWFRSTRWRHCSNGMPATSSISRSIMQSCLAYQHQLPQLQLWNSLQKPRPWRMKTLLGQVLNGWTRGNDTADGDSVSFDPGAASEGEDQSEDHRGGGQLLFRSQAMTSFGNLEPLNNIEMT